MYIEVHDDLGSTFFDSGRVKGMGIELSLETWVDGPKHTVWVEDLPCTFKYAKERDARGCYEYLKAFV